MMRTLTVVGALIAVLGARYLFAYDTHNCPIQPLACDSQTSATLGAPDCKNVFGVYVHIFGFIGTAGQIVMPSVNISPFQGPSISLYGPGDTTAAASNSIFNDIGSTSASIPPYTLQKSGQWYLVVTTLDQYAPYI